MTEPDYANYTIDQLRDALAHINKSAYADRYKRLRDELDLRLAFEDVLEQVDEPREDSTTTWFSSAARQVAKAAPVTALIIAANIGLWALTGWSMPHLGFGISINTPGEDPGINRVIAIVSLSGLAVMFAVGGMSVVFNRRALHRILFLPRWLPN